VGEVDIVYSPQSLELNPLSPAMDDIGVRDDTVSLGQLRQKIIIKKKPIFLEIHGKAC
jgi:hypothetical protein